MTDEQDWRGALRRVTFDASIRSLCCVEAGRGASRFTRQDHSHGDAPALICRVAAEVNPPARKLSDGGVEAIAHQRDLVVGLVTCQQRSAPSG